MDALDRVQEHLEQIARSNAEAAAWRAQWDQWRAKSEQWRAESDQWRAESDQWRAESDQWRAKYEQWRAESDQWRAESDQWRAKYEQWRVESEARAEARHAKAEESKRSLEKQIEKTDKQIEKTDKQIEETEKQVKETEKQVKEASRIMHEVCKEIGGMGQTQGRVAEEFYHQALLEAPRLGDAEFGHVRSNVGAARPDGKHAEYDLLLLNGEMVAVIEVKHKLRREDVEKMRDVTLPNFRSFLCEYNDKTLVPAVAGMTADQDAVALAHECGYAVLLPDGQKVRADVEHLRYIPS